jgi:N-acetylglucosamine-6-sulfatase
MPYLDLFVSYTYREGQGSYYNCPLVVNGRPTPPREKYITEEVTDWAIAFMEKTLAKPEGSKSPFCIYLSHRTAHPPFVSPKGISGMYSGAKVALARSVDSWFSRTNGNVFQGIMMGSYENQYRKYCETITAMDRDILRLLDKIDELGLRDNTIVIYAGDDGMLWGEHRCHGIREPYEESIRIPFIVRCPWLIGDSGSRRSQMVLNTDIAPTLLDIADLPIPVDMEGSSIVPLLQNKEAPGRKAWLLEFWKYYPENTPSYVGVRTETHKYVEYERSRVPEIYDLAADPKEEHNLYGTAEGAKLLPELKGMLDRLKRGKST